MDIFANILHRQSRNKQDVSVETLTDLIREVYSVLGGEHKEPAYVGGFQVELRNQRIPYKLDAVWVLMNYKNAVVGGEDINIFTIVNKSIIVQWLRGDIDSDRGIPHMKECLQCHKLSSGILVKLPSNKDDTIKIIQVTL
jgi:hypothetical protein